MNEDLFWYKGTCAAPTPMAVIAVLRELNSNHCFKGAEWYWLRVTRFFVHICIGLCIYINIINMYVSVYTYRFSYMYRSLFVLVSLCIGLLIYIYDLLFWYKRTCAAPSPMVVITVLRAFLNRCFKGVERRVEINNMFKSQWGFFYESLCISIHTCTYMKRVCSLLNRCFKGVERRVDINDISKKNEVFHGLLFICVHIWKIYGVFWQIWQPHCIALRQTATCTATLRSIPERRAEIDGFPDARTLGLFRVLLGLFWVLIGLF